MDGGGDRNNCNLQNLLAYFGGWLVSGIDKMFIYRGCQVYSYLLTAERAMAILNIALANLALCVNLNSPRFSMSC